MQQDVAHIEDAQYAHSGQQHRTDQALAHIAWSLRDAHRLLNMLQSDVQARLGRLEVRVDAMTTSRQILERIASLAPIIGPAMMALVAIMIVILSLTGHKDTAAVLGTLKPPG